MRNELEWFIEFKYNKDTYYYIKNAQRDILGILDSNYNQVANYEYDSWGNILSIKDNNGYDVTNDMTHIGNINPFRYRSYYYDTETKLYYLNSRYYNPEWGRFLNLDSYGGQVGKLLSHNGYIYVYNNSINQFDIDGNFAISLSGAGAIYGAAILAGMLLSTKNLSISYTGLLYPLVHPAPAIPKIEEKDETDSKILEKLGPIIDSQPERKPCTSAKILFHDVIRGTRLTIIGSITYVGTNGDIMCDNQISAFAVAQAYAPRSYYDGIHHNGELGYYPHYHPWEGKGHPHIWFYP